MNFFAALGVIAAELLVAIPVALDSDVSKESDELLE